MINSIYDISITSLEGKTIDLNDFKGKKIYGLSFKINDS